MSIHDDHRLPILFHDYSRYRAVADVVRAATEGRPARLLDVGSGPHCLLHQLAPEYPTLCLDPALLGREAVDRIAGTAESPLVEGQRFDWVISVDTLQDVPPGERDAFLIRLSSLADDGLIVGGPFADAGEAERTDAEVAEIYRRLIGSQHPHLHGSRMQGLPSLVGSRALLESLGWRCEPLPHGHAPWLRELLPILLACLEVEPLRPVAWRLSDWFNRHLAPLDRLEPAYRWLIVARRSDRKPVRRALPRVDPRDAERRWRELRDKLAPLVLEVAVEALRDEPIAEGAVERLSRVLDEEHLIEERRALDDRAADLESEAEGLRRDLERLASSIEEARALRRELSDIHASRLWRFGDLYWRARRRAIRGAGRALALLPGRSAAPRLATCKPAQAAEAPSAAGCRGFDVVCFPIIDWDFRFQRPQQLARRLAAAGHRVFYVRTGLRRGAREARWRERERLVFDLELPAARDLNLYEDEMDPASLALALGALDDLRLAAGDHPTVCLVQLPFWTPLASAASERWGWRLVYDCMDEHAGFATTGPAMLAQEAELIANADLVVTSSRSLHEKAAPARRRLLLPNAADFPHFHAALRAPAKLRERPVIGYYGAIAEWFDTELVADAARRRPDWRFVLVGSTFGARLGELARLRNVELVGERPYHDLPERLADFDVAIIPFRRSELTLATNPVKFYEYLAAGKPVVAVTLPELEPFREHFYPVDQREQFVPQLEAALGESDPHRVAARVEVARRETWERRQEVLSDAVDELYGRATIVIVSYNNAEYLRRCLDSLRDHTLYPRYEVVVVDNASGDDVRELLRRREAEEPRLRVILNRDTVGFPRANNQARAELGDSEFVVLLNDDTVVTRGWLGRLLRYLEQDPSIGLVGPVTNWIGNEAQIPVGYDDLGGLDEFAAQLVRQKHGRTFEIPVLAMYCVAMRRRLLDEIGLLDERFGIGMFEDDDFAKRVRRAGQRLVCAEDVFVHHWGKSSFKRLDEQRYQRVFEENRRLFEEKWGEPWQAHQRRRDDG